MLNKIMIVLLFFKLVSSTHLQAKPKMTIVLVIDQLSYQNLYNLKDYYKFGLKNLIKKGINYHEAYQVHGSPATAAGHASIATGTCASHHGFVLNAWNGPDGKKRRCTQDDRPESYVLTPNGLADYGHSARYLMVDTLSDQFVNEKRDAYALSYKPRAAIAMAGRRGDAFWYDNKTMMFTSSKAYMDELPTWITTFNTDHNPGAMTMIKWPLFFEDKDHPAYQQFVNPDYSYASIPMRLAGSNLSIKKNETNDRYNNKNIFERCPQANESLLHLSHHCIEHHVKNHPDKEGLFWIGISALDKLGHPFGPDSYECVDMIYHLDKQLGEFFDTLYTIVNKEDCLIVLTSDHGITPIPELLNKQGFDLAQRIPRNKIMNEMNHIVEEHFGITKLISSAKTNAFYFDHTQFDHISSQDQQEVTALLQSYLASQPGVKNVWTPDQLKQQSFSNDSLEKLYQNQLYEGRNGDLICMPHTFCHFSKGSGGASHQTPHEHNLHVPLILYQPNRYEKQNCTQKVTITQCAPSLAHILQSNRPSASTSSLLPLIKLKKNNKLLQIEN